MLKYTQFNVKIYTIAYIHIYGERAQKAFTGTIVPGGGDLNLPNSLSQKVVALVVLPV